MCLETVLQPVTPKTKEEGRQNLKTRSRQERSKTMKMGNSPAAD